MNEIRTVTDRNNQVGNTDLKVSQLGMGCGTLGDPDEVTSDDQASATLMTAWQGGIRYYDTAPWYGNTLSEHRVGHFLRQQPRDQFAISTKVGRVYSSPRDPAALAESAYMKRWTGGLPFELRFDYSRAGITRSYEDSLTRMGLNRVDALVIHDLDPRHRLNEQGVADGLHQLDAGGGYAVLAELKAQGDIKAIGAGINHVGMIPRFIERFDIDYFLVAMPYTLLDQSALDAELSLLEQKGISVVIGAVFASGVLATGVTDRAQYAYQPLNAEVADRVQQISAVCQRFGVSLSAAALQFPLAHPSVKSVIPGANHPDQVESNLQAIREPIAAEFWSELKDHGLLRADAPCPVGA